MGETGHLILDPPHEIGVRVPDAEREDAAEEVEVLAAVGVLHARPLRLGDHDGLGVVVGDAGEEELFVLRPDRLSIH